ncbi:hypothetical protein NDU88_003607 [Pleurodeles waltl]|uniref:Uncharacterized protein n=1 Tax=Pleurodeles waltl TaxID=8319 RepID=A0AAV7LIY9_PLEWA|nr:hypothetical protein NDU88_003607 [Pleurodeles waltl]
MRDAARTKMVGACEAQGSEADSWPRGGERNLTKAPFSGGRWSLGMPPPPLLWGEGAAGDGPLWRPWPGTASRPGHSQEGEEAERARRET